MNQLIPPEVLAKIFVHLPLYEILRLRTVNKKFRFTIDSLLRLEKLMIYSSVIPVNYLEFSTYRPFDCLHSVQTLKLETIENHLKVPMFSALKQLKINDEFLHNYPNTCELLNYFKNLTSLEIAAVRLRQAGTLSLPNLRILTVHFTCYDGNTNKLRLNTKRLERLRFEYYNNQMNLDLSNPETISHCWVNEFHPIIKSMTNLQCLLVNRWKAEIDHKLLHHFSRIQEIHLNRCGHVFSNLKNQAKLYGHDVTIYLLGIAFGEVTSELLDSLSFESSQRTVELLHAHYDKLSPVIPEIYYLEYNYLEENFKKIPDDLIGRLVSLQSVFVKRILDINEFLRFFKQCKSLTALEIKNSTLDQAFYSNLSNACPTLQYRQFLVKVPLF